MSGIRCNKCDVEFTTNDGLFDHAADVHGPRPYSTVQLPDASGMYADRPSYPTPPITQVELLAMPCPPHAYHYEGLRAVDGVDMWVWRCVKCQHEDVEDIGPF